MTLQARPRADCGHLLLALADVETLRAFCSGRTRSWPSA